MPPNPADNPTLRNLALAGLLCCALLGFAWWKSTVTTQRRACRICAVELDHKALVFYDNAVAVWETDAKPSAETEEYFDRYLGYPHAHEWAEGGYYRYRLHNPGYVPSGFGPYPVHQMYLTDLGLRLVAASGIREPEKRRRYFESLIEPRDMEHLKRVMKTFGKIRNQPPDGMPTDRIWSPDMECIAIPDEVTSGGLLPDGN